MTQEQALQILQTGANVFLTGEPGAGKTYTINRFVAWLRERGIEPAITASTGIAATHIGGMTIHSWSGIGVRSELTEWDLEALLEREPLVRRVRSTHVLILDEVSMLSAQTLTLVDQALRVLRGSEQPFGGMQVIFVGDFFQLPPVTRKEVPLLESVFACESRSWAEANPLCCYLSEQHRQEDAEFLELLGALRKGAITAAHKATLRSRAALPPASVRTTLYPHNADVDRINDEELSRLDAPLRVHSMASEGGKTLVEALKRGCLSPETLALKEGALVMFTRNNFEKGYVNGTLGEVVGYSEGGFPLVRTRQGLQIEAAPEEWRIDDRARTLAKISQVPLRLAWAITIHKSQGMSLDAALMDLRQAFEYGQGYVALSRVRSLAGLYLSGFNERALMVHPQIIERDEDFRTASAAAAEAFAAIPLDELGALHKQFTKRIGGREPEEVKKSKEAGEGMGMLEKIRQKFPHAYKPWSAEDDARLTAAFHSEAKVSTLVKEFGRQRGAINSRLIRLGLVEPDL
jgi:ATP-dependent DNA helicase PIF1